MKLSIITVNYNDKFGLEKTINSLINQTYKNYEYIIIDGGSTDGSLDIIKKYQEHISYWISQPDKGIYHAMNKATKVAKNDYLFFLNARDIFIDNNVLRSVSEFYNKNNLNQDFIYGDVIQGNLTTKYPSELSFKILYDEVFSHQAFFIKKDVFDKFGAYDLKYSLSADWIHFVHNLVFNNCTYKKINISICIYDLDGKSSQSGAYIKIRQQREDYFKEYLPLFYKDYKTYDNIFFNILIKAYQHTFTKKVLDKISYLYLKFK